MSIDYENRFPKHPYVQGQRNGFDFPLRVLLYSHDSVGLGHLRRNLAIAGEIAATFPNSSVLVVTGSQTLPLLMLASFGFGLLIAYPFREVLMRAAGVVRSWSWFLTVALVLAFSGFYEVIEGIVAMIVDPELGMAYLGTQGDEWDAQKDTFLAFSGSVVAMLVTRLAAPRCGGRWDAAARRRRNPRPERRAAGRPRW